MPQVMWHVSLLDGPAGLPAAPRIASLSYALELESLCIACASGELLLLSLESREVEEVGCIEGGIAALEWSPDGEVLAAISGSGNLLVMTRVSGFLPGRIASRSCRCHSGITLGGPAPALQRPAAG